MRANSIRNLVIVLGIVVLVGLSAVAVGSTISGTVQLDGDSATDGSTFSYELDDEDEVSDLSVEVTGSDNIRTESVSGSLRADLSIVLRFIQIRTLKMLKF